MLPGNFGFKVKNTSVLDKGRTFFKNDDVQRILFIYFPSEKKQVGLILSKKSKTFLTRYIILARPPKISYGIQNYRGDR